MSTDCIYFYGKCPEVWYSDIVKKMSTDCIYFYSKCPEVSDTKYPIKWYMQTAQTQIRLLLHYLPFHEVFSAIITLRKIGKKVYNKGHLLYTEPGMYNLPDATNVDL